MKKLLDEIFERELKRLDDMSKKHPLDLEELRRLETMTRSLKNYQEPEKQETDDFDNLTTDELLNLVRGGTPDDEKRQAESVPRLKRPSGSRKAKGKRGPVEEG